MQSEPRPTQGAQCLAALRLPALHCPFPSHVSPYCDQIEADNLAWLKRFGFAQTTASEFRLRAACFGRLAARAYPGSSLEGLRIAAAWASWLFLRDDQCDEAGMGGDPPAVRALSIEHMAVLTGRRRPERQDALARALADLGERMLERGGLPWMTRFLLDVHDYFDATVWEAENRSCARVPDLKSYLRMRDHTGAVKTCFDIHELAGGAALPLQARCHPRLARMMQLANRAICWSNDIFSVEKEQRHGDCHNLVIVLAHHRELALHDATLHAARLHDGAVREFERLETQLLQNAEPCAAVDGFVTALKCWMRANVDWSIETGRYA